MSHGGPLPPLRSAAGSAERLVIGVADDETVARRLGTEPTVPEEERLEIVVGFFPEQTVELVATDRADVLVARYGADAVFVCGPVAAQPGGPGAVAVIPVPFEMTTSESLLRTVEPDVLWTLH
jgi:hypothetical protein